ncbi:MAG: hypothetical protein AB8G96_07470 [Phycisphaerales bacterium]
MKLQSSTVPPSLISQLDPQSAAEKAKKSAAGAAPTAPAPLPAPNLADVGTSAPPTTSHVGPHSTVASMKSVPESVMHEELTLDGLMKHWGMSDTAYDLDASGTVDMQDLVKMLAGMEAAKVSGTGTGNGPPPPPPGDAMGADAPMKQKIGPTISGAPPAPPAPSGKVPSFAATDPGAAQGIAPTTTTTAAATGTPSVVDDRLAATGPVETAASQANAKKRAMIDARAAAEAAANSSPLGTTGAAPIDPAMAAAIPEVKDAAKAAGLKDAGGDANRIDPLLAATAPDGAAPIAVDDLLSNVDPSLATPDTASEESTAPTVEGLMEAWGSDDAMYDLDGNGTVGMNDLLQMLAGMDDGGGDGDTPAPTLDGLMKAWGTDEPMYDLDGDGSVGMNDLLQLIAGENDPPSGLDLPDDAKVAEFAAAWGTSDPTFDVDGDGIVGERDLAALMAGIKDASAGSIAATDPTATDPAVDALLETLAAVEPKEADKAADVGTTGAATTGHTVPAELSNVAPDRALRMEMLGGPTSPWARLALTDATTVDISTVAGLSDYSVQAATVGTKEAAADVIAASVKQRLNTLGFGDAPPTNLHEIVDGLKLSDADASMVMDRLNARYPKGLGLSVVA